MKRGEKKVTFDVSNFVPKLSNYLIISFSEKNTMISYDRGSKLITTSNKKVTHTSISPDKQWNNLHLNFLWYTQGWELISNSFIQNHSNFDISNISNIWHSVKYQIRMSNMVEFQSYWWNLTILGHILSI